MKTFIIFWFALLNVMMVLSDAHKYDDKYKTAILACLTDMKITTEEFGKMCDNKDEKVSCVLACANKKLNVFDGTKFDAEKIHKFNQIETTKKQIEYTTDMKVKMEKCIEAGNGADGDECKKTDVYFKCVIRNDDLIKLM
nr:odorant binding protein 6 [Trissolcus basalis]